MSKIGRRDIPLNGVEIAIEGLIVRYKGKNSSGEYTLTGEFEASVSEQALTISPKSGVMIDRDINRLWGLHRALLNNKIRGASTFFERQLKIIGLGFKAVRKDSGLQFSLGYSHKIDFTIPDNVVVDIDKTGQLLTLKSYDKERLGAVCSKIRALRKPEPYKGTGIQYSDEVIFRKVGKTK